MWDIPITLLLFFPCTGAQVYGDTGRAVYHYRIAREHLGYLFDISDYAVAEALTAMRWVREMMGLIFREPDLHTILT